MAARITQCRWNRGGSHHLWKPHRPVTSSRDTAPQAGETSSSIRGRQYCQRACHSLPPTTRSAAIYLGWGHSGAVRTRWRGPSSRPRSTTAARRSAPRQAPPALPVQHRHRRLGSEPTGWRQGCGPMSEPEQAEARLPFFHGTCRDSKKATIWATCCGPAG